MGSFRYLIEEHAFTCSQIIQCQGQPFIRIDGSAHICPLAFDFVVDHVEDIVKGWGIHTYHATIFIHITLNGDDMKPSLIFLFALRALRKQARWILYYFLISFIHSDYIFCDTLQILQFFNVFFNNLICIYFICFLETFEGTL